MMKSVKCMRFLCMLLAIFCAAGCNRQADTQPREASDAGESSIQIKLAVSSSADAKEIGNRIAAFNEAHADFQVELVNLPGDRYDETLNMMMTSGEGPDVFQLGTGWLPTYIYKNWLLDLSEVADPRIRDAFPKWAADYTKQNNHYYAIPSSLITTRLIYNRDLLEDAGCAQVPPATLAQLRECADKVSLAGTGYHIYGFALPAGEDQAGFQQPLETASTYSGIGYYHFADGKYDFSGYIPWFRTMLDMKRSGGLFPGELTLESDTALTQFAEGNVGMMIVTNRNFALLSRMKPPTFELGIAEPPVLEAGDAGKGALMVDPEPPLVINAYTGHKKEAAELWEYLHSPDFLGPMYRSGDMIPTLASVRNDPEYQPPLSNFAAFLPNGKDSPYPQVPRFVLQNGQTPSSPKNLGDAERMKAYREILQEIRPAEEVLEDLSGQYNKSLDKAVENKLINLGDYIFPSFDARSPLAEYNRPAAPVSPPPS